MARIDHPRLFIGGHWTRAQSADVITVTSANTEKPIGSAPSAGTADIDAAVAAARAAFDDPKGWAAWSAADRAGALVRFAEAVDARAEEIARRVSDQNGMPIFLSTASDSRRPGDLLRYYATQIRAMAAEQERGRSLVRTLPVGVVAAIAPWNFPNTMAALKYAPALAAGCTVVLKPSPETVLDAILIADAAIESGLPPGVLNIVPGGPEAGAHLVGHPGVDKISFTGSTATGRRIGAVAGRLLRPMTLELGGKSAAIVLDDADLDPARIGPALMPSLFGNNGQTCFLTARVLAPRSRYAEVVDTIAGLARSLTVGDSLAPATRIGPLVSARQRDRVERYIAIGRDSGARLVTGGGRPAGEATGWFVEPTVFADVDNRDTIAREEIFGPVVTITGYDGDDEAVRLADDSEYGLAATVWTGDPDRGLAVARRLRTGTVGLNGYTPDLNAPTTMIKASGTGVKFGPEALRSYQRFQSVYR
jgi:acyl-CoA reductase-like NAD-dependent aldehyde dehydrogenase